MRHHLTPARMMDIKKSTNRDSPGGSEVDSMLLLYEVWVWSLVRELRPHMLHCMVKKSLKIANVGEDMEKTKSLYTVGGNVHHCSHDGKQYIGSSKEIKKAIIWLSNSHPGYISKKSKKINSKRWMQNSVHSSIIYNTKIWEQPKCPLPNEWIKEMWCLKQDFSGQKKKNENLPFAIMCVDLKGYFAQWNVRQRRTNTLCYHLYVEYRKNTNECI